MSVINPIPRTTATHPTPRRSLLIDAVRAGSMLVVVLLHSFMVGASRAPDGSLVMAPAMLGQDWFVPVSWAVQVMPLFFLAGGYSALASWRRRRHEGWARFVAGRVARLVLPATLMIGVVALALAAARIAGAPAEAVAEAGFRIGQPLWFLAVYLGVSALVPALAWLHERAPWRLLAGLGAGIVAVDLAGTAGYLSLLFAWPFALVLGFHFLDGAASAWGRRRLAAGVLVPLAALLVLTTAGGYSPDMIVNLNPPTLALALLGVAQFFLLRLLAPAIEAGAARVPRLVRAADSHAMSLYLWHMPALMALTAALFLGGAPLPAAHSPEWWATRVAWLVLVAALLVPLVLAARAALARLPELRPGRNPRGSVQATVAGVAGILALLVGGFTLAPAVLALLGLALWLATGRELRLSGPARR